MASIKQGIDDTIKSFVETNFPAGLADSSALKDLKKKTKKEVDTLDTFWKDADDVSEVYQFISSGPTSYPKKSTSSIRTVLAMKNAQIAELLPKLEEDGVKGLGEALIAVTADSSSLEKCFNGIDSIFKSLDGDLTKASDADDFDDAYKMILQLLTDKDKAAAAASETAIKKGDTLVEKLEALNAKEIGVELGEVKANIGGLYKSLVDITLSYQDVQPKLDEFSALQAGLKTAIADLETDLTNKTAAAILQAKVDFAALKAKREELRQQNILNEKMLPAPAPEADKNEIDTSSEGTGVAEVTPPPPAAPPEAVEISPVDGKISEANKVLDDNKINKENYTKIVGLLKSAMTRKDNFNAKIELHLKPLTGTKETGLKLKKQVAVLESSLADLTNDLVTLKDAVKKDMGIVNAFTTGLESVGLIQDKLVTLNTAISTAEFSDIKEYFAKAVLKLDAFPEVGNKVIGNVLLIEHTAVDLEDWASTLQKDLEKTLFSALKGSALDFEPLPEPEMEEGGTKSVINVTSGQEIDKLIARLTGKKLRDEDMIPAVELVSPEAWPTKGDEKVTNLADCVAIFEEKLAAIKLANEKAKKTIEFLGRLNPKSSAA